MRQARRAVHALRRHRREDGRRLHEALEQLYKQDLAKADELFPQVQEQVIAGGMGAP